MRNSLDISLYVIVDPAQCLHLSPVEVAKQAAENGATIIQYRDKIVSDAAFASNANALSYAIKHTGVPLLLNDRHHLFYQTAADGVHIGPGDGNAADVRQYLGPEPIIGCSIKADQGLDFWQWAVLDYGFIGPVFTTKSKFDTGACLGLAGLAELLMQTRTNASKLPIGAISGINLVNAGDVLHCGVMGIAMISQVCGAKNAGKNVRAFRRLIDSALK